MTAAVLMWIGVGMVGAGFYLILGAITVACVSMHARKAGRREFSHGEFLVGCIIWPLYYLILVKLVVQARLAKRRRMKECRRQMLKALRFAERYNAGPEAMRRIAQRHQANLDKPRDATGCPLDPEDDGHAK